MAGGGLEGGGVANLEQSLHTVCKQFTHSLHTVSKVYTGWRGGGGSKLIKRLHTVSRTFTRSLHTVSKRLHIACGRFTVCLRNKHDRCMYIFRLGIAIVRLMALQRRLHKGKVRARTDVIQLRIHSSFGSITMCSSQFISGINCTCSVCMGHTSSGRPSTGASV